MIPDNQALQKSPPRGVSRRASAALDAYGATGSGIQALTAFVFPALGIGGGGGFWGLGDGRTSGGFLESGQGELPFENVNAYNSSVVMACVNAIVAGFKQAPPRVYKMKTDGTKTYLPQHRLQGLLNRPNPFYSRNKLLGAAMASYLIKGNGYIYKEKADGGLGATRALYYIPHFAIIPRRPFDGSTFVGWYEYNVNGKTYRLRPDQVIHLRFELDPYNTLLGRSPLQPVLTTIFSDEEADKFTSALLKNTAIPGTIIAPDTDKVRVKPADAEAIKENFKHKFGGSKRGETLVLSFAAKLFQMGFSPEQLQMKDARRLPEERVSAQYRIPASFAGLGAGLDRTTYSNTEQMEKKAYETGIVPLWQEVAEEFLLAFEAEFFALDDTYGVEFDSSKVKAMSENADAITARSTKIWVVNGSDRAEYRTANGLTVDPARDENVFYADTKPVVPAPAGQDAGAGADAQGGGKKTLRSRITQVLRLKAAPAATLDSAYDMMLEADVIEQVRLMTAELDELYRSIGEEAYKAARELDRDNPKAESTRIVEDVIKAVGLSVILLSIWGSMGEEVEDGTKAATALRLGASPDSVWSDGSQVIVQNALKQAATTYEQSLEEQTRTAVEAAIKGAERGESVQSIANTIKGMVQGRAMYPGIYDRAFKAAKDGGASDEGAAKTAEAQARNYRAKLIAETETRNYQNTASLESMSVAGVEQVYVEDGDACGWRAHDDTDKAHNTTRPIGEAKRYPLVHPACKRRFFPTTPGTHHSTRQPRNEGGRFSGAPFPE